MSNCKFLISNSTIYETKLTDHLDRSKSERGADSGNGHDDRVTVDKITDPTPAVVSNNWVKG